MQFLICSGHHNHVPRIFRCNLNLIFSSTTGAQMMSLCLITGCTTFSDIYWSFCYSYHIITSQKYIFWKKATISDTCFYIYTLENLKWTRIAIPFWLRKNVICFSSENYLLCLNGTHIFVKHFIFIWEWKTCCGKFGMELPFPNEIPVLRVYKKDIIKR